MQAGIGEGAKILAEPSEFVYQGNVYKLAQAKLNILWAFEDYLIEQVLETFRKHRTKITASTWAETEYRILRDAGAGAYSEGSDVWALAMRSIKHLCYFFYLRLKPYHEDMTLELATEILISDAENERRMYLMDADPNRVTPPENGEPEGEGLSADANFAGDSLTHTPNGPPIESEN